MIKGGVEIAVTLIIIRVIMFIHVGSSVPPQTQRSLNRKILGLCRKQTVFINYIQYCSVVMSVHVRPTLYSNFYIDFSSSILKKKLLFIVYIHHGDTTKLSFCFDTYHIQSIVYK